MTALQQLDDVFRRHPDWRKRFIKEKLKIVATRSRQVAS